MHGIHLCRKHFTLYQLAAPVVYVEMSLKPPTRMLSCFLGASSITLNSFRAAALLLRSHTTAGRLSVGMIPSCGGVQEHSAWTQHGGTKHQALNTIQGVNNT
jgi:hypothetical protein